jgi:carbonic anhydrase
MRLFEAIMDANHRAVAGDKSAGLRLEDYSGELPVIALTCVDPRLNALLPQALDLPGDQFIWLRNAGNIITGPLSSTMRSLALACAVKGGREIVILGHTDCQVCKTTTMLLLEKLKELGVERHWLPENLNEFFGMFASERQNVVKACEIVRHSPLIGAHIPVQGFVMDIRTGKLEWVVNGYQSLPAKAGRLSEITQAAGQTADALKSLASFNLGELKFPDVKIGDVVTKAAETLVQEAAKLEAKPHQPPPPIVQATHKASPARP